MLFNGWHKTHHATSPLKRGQVAKAAESQAS
jgi:hypothetical protein